MTGDREKMTTGDWKKNVDRKKKLIAELKKKNPSLEFPRELGDEMLHPVGEEHMMEATRERVRRLHGWTEEQIERAYGKPRSKEEIERALDEVRERARRHGWTEEMIEREYGKPAHKAMK
jgi:glutamate synthase domain-containing protein 3